LKKIKRQKARTQNLNNFVGFQPVSAVIGPTERALEKAKTGKTGGGDIKGNCGGEPKGDVKKMGAENSVAPTSKKEDGRVPYG